MQLFAMCDFNLVKIFQQVSFDKSEHRKVRAENFSCILQLKKCIISQKITSTIFLIRAKKSIKKYF